MQLTAESSAVGTGAAEASGRVVKGFKLCSSGATKWWYLGANVSLFGPAALQEEGGKAIWWLHPAENSSLPFQELICLLPGITEMPGCHHTAFHIANPYLYKSDKTNPGNRIKSPVWASFSKKQAKNVLDPSLLSAAEVTWLYGTPSVHLKSFSSLALVQQGPEEGS